MSAVRFEEPPTSQRVATHNSKVAGALRARPGEWALVRSEHRRSRASSFATQIRGRALAFQPAGTFEAVTRVVGSEHRVYARFVGEATAA